jgi:preprotein translocase subunit YajC
MNFPEFVIAVLFLVFAFAIIRHKMGIPDRSLRQMMDGDSGDAENARLKGQVEKLQDRIRVLERIVTDSGVQTAAQIEALRERDKIAEDESNG